MIETTLKLVSTDKEGVVDWITGQDKEFTELKGELQASGPQGLELRPPHNREFFFPFSLSSLLAFAPLCTLVSFSPIFPYGHGC